MNATISNSIKTRRNSLFNYYNLTSDAEKKADNLFSRIEQFGEGCEDAADFENKFSVSPLNMEYMNLFTEFAEFVKTPEGTLTVEEQQKETAKTVAESAVKSQVELEVKKQIINALPDEVTDLYVYGIYKIWVTSPVQ